MNSTAAAGEIARDVTDVFCWDGDFHIEYGLQQGGLALHEGLAKHLTPGDLKGDVLAVHRVCFAVNKQNLHIHDLKALTNLLMPIL